MGWVAAIVILVLLVISAGFRKFALTLLVTCAVVGFVLYHQHKSEEAKALSRVDINEIAFDNVRLLGSDYRDYEIVGRVKNNSNQYTLKGVNLKITFRDCPQRDSLDGCVVIGEIDEFLSLNIPPGQARDFEESVYLYGDKMKPKGRLVWGYHVDYTKAE